MAIAVGNVLGSRISERVVRVASALAFVAFGVLLIAEGLRSL